MLQIAQLTIKFTYKGKEITRKIDRIKHIFDAYTYTIYRLQGTTSNFDLLKCGKWWQVNINEPLPPALIEIIGDAIDEVEKSTD